LKNGFSHVDVAGASRKYTAFVTHAGQYQELTRKGIALPYIYDIIITAKNEEDIRINELIGEQIIESFDEKRHGMSEVAKRKIRKLHQENRRSYNLLRKPARKY